MLAESYIKSKVKIVVHIAVTSGLAGRTRSASVRFQEFSVVRRTDPLFRNYTPLNESVPVRKYIFMVDGLEENLPSAVLHCQEFISVPGRPFSPGTFSIIAILKAMGLETPFVPGELSKLLKVLT